MILHGIYDNGKIILTDNNAPRIKANVEINIIEELESPKKAKNKKNNSIIKLRGIWKSRDDIKESSEWIQARRRRDEHRQK